MKVVIGNCWFRPRQKYKYVVKVESSYNSIKLDLTYGQVGYRNAKEQQTNQIATFKKLQIMQIKGLRACARLAEHKNEMRNILEQRVDCLNFRPFLQICWIQTYCHILEFCLKHKVNTTNTRNVDIWDWYFPRQLRFSSDNRITWGIMGAIVEPFVCSYCVDNCWAYFLHVLLGPTFFYMY